MQYVVKRQVLGNLIRLVYTLCWGRRRKRDQTRSEMGLRKASFVEEKSRRKWLRIDRRM